MIEMIVQNEAANVQTFTHHQTRGINPGLTINTFDTTDLPLGRAVKLEITSFRGFVSIFVDIKKKGGGIFGRNSRLSHTFEFNTDEDLTIPLYEDWCLCVTAPEMLHDGDTFQVHLQRFQDLPRPNKLFLREALR
jgi:hypothetical protein